MATPINIPITVNPPDLGGTVNAFKDLKNQLREQIGILATLTAGTDEYIAQAARVGSIRDQVNDLNDSIRATSGAPIENLTNSFGLLSGQVRNLDFEGATSSLRQFGGSLKTVSFKDLSEGFKSFGKVALDVGKGLLLNPLFLIPALIIGIGAALFALKDKIKPIGDFFDYIGGEIEKTIQTLKDFTDLLGLSSFAAEKAANARIEASKKQGDAITEYYDNEIKYAKAAGKSVADLEKAKGEAVRANIRQQIEDLVRLALINGKYSDEQLKQLEEFKKAYKTSLVETKVATLTNQKEIDDKAREAYKKRQEELKEQGKQNVESQKAIDAQVLVNKKSSLDLFSQATQKAAEEEAKQHEEIILPNLETQQAQEKVIKDTYRQLDAEADRAFREQQYQDNVKAAQDSLNIASDGLKSLQGLSDLVFSIKSANTKKGSKEEEAAARKQFQINKALQLTGAVINGAQAITTSLAAAPPVIGVAPNPAGIAALIGIGITTAATIAKISAQQFNPQSSGGASGGSVPTAGLSGGGASAPSPQSSAFNPNTVGQVGTPGAQNASNQPQRVYVVESDITKVQSKVAVTESQASF